MSRTAFYAGVALLWMAGAGSPGRAVAASDAGSDALAEAKAAMDGLKAEMRAWRNNAFELQKRLVSEDKDLAKLQKRIAEKEEEALRLRQEFTKRLDAHPEMAARREQQRALAEKYKEAQEAYARLGRQRGGDQP